MAEHIYFDLVQQLMSVLPTVEYFDKDENSVCRPAHALSNGLLTYSPDFTDWSAYL